MSQRNYLYELEKFLKEYGHNEELSILTACQKASMNDEIFKSAGEIGDFDSKPDSPDSDDYDGSSSGWGNKNTGISEKKIDIPEGFCDSWAYTGSSLLLTGIGLAPGIGIFSDLSNAVLNMYCGDYIYAFLSLVSAIPLVGYIGNALKAVFAGLKGTIKGGPALVKIIVNWWKNSKKGRELKKAKDKLKKAQDELDDYMRNASAVDQNTTRGLYQNTDLARVTKEGLEAEVTALAQATDRAKDIMRSDWSDFTKAFFEIRSEAGQFSKIFGISNQTVRSFTKWSKDILYQIEEQVIGFDDNVREYRIGD